MVCPGFGEVELLPSGVRNSMAHRIGSRKAAALAGIPEVMRLGKQIDAQGNWKGRGYDTRVLASKVGVGDSETNYVAVVVKKDLQRNRYYLHEMLDENGSIIKIDKKKMQHLYSRLELPQKAGLPERHLHLLFLVYSK